MLISSTDLVFLSFLILYVKFLTFLGSLNALLISSQIFLYDVSIASNAVTNCFVDSTTSVIILSTLIFSLSCSSGVSFCFAIITFAISSLLISLNVILMALITSPFVGGGLAADEVMILLNLRSNLAVSPETCLNLIGIQVQSNAFFPLFLVLLSFTLSSGSHVNTFSFPYFSILLSTSSTVNSLSIFTSSWYSFFFNLYC